ncbi:hypothetical protein GLOIN_2v1781457 [Rhizophagus irregularis DAOM 181602=DAOM 197198]|uniref:Uncharacterized protein n=1 Tax=Rhizophagus irregularis (strain DAOM 181602 / DAOM 197198 / MUCL 43194) TaxID=747089 RepID=A0A2P4PJZ1_RHIID|nr:hypothetical protein GLOIN_2v1781457 [Rhizophagus irregularis DAOM 181602=DAOM 197198]POG65706.1 hypothetical protein GLOIN_2v1781457 [Rhizophagus irregularis DAOM 181602=DAOM 197198]|eukprot:XP_025172572.1 hypothetical protein GLOIN_2v1781457 [Rhizophagus irregularis DAOM 181602=DAOM 197198]
MATHLCEHYDVGLILEISQECWDGEPTENPQLSNGQELNEVPLSTNISELQGELSQLIQNFNKMNTIKLII